MQRRGDEIAKYVDDLLAKYRNVLGKSTKAPRVYLSCSGDNVIPCHAQTRSGEVLDFLGAINVVGTAEAAPMRPVTFDDMKTWDPDVIVVAGNESAARLAREWPALRAVSGQRVHVLPSLPFNWGPRPPSVNRLMGMIWLAYVLPGKTFDKAYYADMRGLFTTLYHFTPSDEQMQRIVAGAN